MTSRLDNNPIRESPSRAKKKQEKRREGTATATPTDKPANRHQKPIRTSRDNTNTLPSEMRLLESCDGDRSSQTAPEDHLFNASVSLVQRATSRREKAANRDGQKDPKILSPAADTKHKKQMMGRNLKIAERFGGDGKLYGIRGNPHREWTTHITPDGRKVS